MKHIKLYEDLKPHEQHKLRKYNCIKYENVNAGFEYYIDEIINVTEYYVNYKIIYKYIETKDEFEEVVEQDTIESNSLINRYLKSVEYSSDKLNDCFDNIRILVNSDKYNL